MKNLFTILCSTTLLILPSLVYAKCCVPGSVAVCKGECCATACDSKGECPNRCPNGGTLVDDVFCCKDGKMMVDMGPKQNIGKYMMYGAACGCPDGGIPDKLGVGCCKGGKYMEVFSITGKYDQDADPKDCGCPEHEELVKPDRGTSGQCCPVGHIWLDP